MKGIVTGAAGRARAERSEREGSSTLTSLPDTAPAQPRASTPVATPELESGSDMLAKDARGRGRLVRRMLVSADVIGLVLAYATSVLIFRQRIGPDDPIEVRHEILLFALTLPGWVLLSRLHGLYDRDEERASHSTRDETVGVIHLVTVGTFLSFAAAWVTGLARPYPPKLLTFWALGIVFIALARVAARAIARSRESYAQNAVILGADPSSQLVARKILDHPEYGVDIVGFVDGAAERGALLAGSLPVLGGPDDLRGIVQEHDVSRVIIGFFDHPVDEAIALVNRVKDLDIQIDIVPRLFEALDPSAKLHTVEGFPLIGLSPPRYWRSSLFLKRSFDLLVAAVSLVILSPLLLWIAFRVHRGSPGPRLYRHERIGQGGRPFQLLKFRTMHADGTGSTSNSEHLERLLSEDPAAKEEFARTQKLVDDPRVTPYGRFLRRTSLDELPQLVNVLKGEMSLVGPRPVTAAELERYGDHVDVLLAVRPGVTGYWQVNGRSRTDYQERVRLDVSYVRGWSLRLDVAILGKTAWTLLKGRDAY